MKEEFDHLKSACQNIYKEVIDLSQKISEGDKFKNAFNELEKKKEYFRNAALKWHEKYCQIHDEKEALKEAYKDVMERIENVGKQRNASFSDIDFIIDPLRKLFER